MRPTADQRGVGNHVRNAVVRYYDDTWVDYRFAWLNGSNMAMHFGFHDERKRGHGETLQNTNRVLADLTAVRPGDRVLDAGCGIGGSSLWLGRHRGAEVTGITLVPSQVRHASRRAKRQGLQDRVTFKVADYTDTGFEAGSFDVVWALESLCHAPSKPSFYREAARVLRPGGRLVVADYIRRERPFSTENEQLVRQWLDGWEIPDIDTRDEHVGAATEAGLESITLKDRTQATRRSIRRAYTRARLAFPVLSACHKLGFRNGVQHRNAIACQLHYQALVRGLWFYGVLTAKKPL